MAELRNKCQRMIGQFQDEFEALKTSKSDSELQRDLKFQRACMTSRLVYIYATVAFEACMDREFKVLMANFLVMVMTVKTDLEEFSKSCEKESDSKRMCGYVKNMGRRHRTLSDLYGLSEKKREIGDVISDVLQDLRQVSERAGNFWDGNGKLAKYRALM